MCPSGQYLESVVVSILLTQSNYYNHTIYAVLVSHHYCDGLLRGK